MRCLDVYPLVATERLAECRDFYVRLGFQVALESTWFVLLVSGGDRSFSLAFMRSDHPTQEPEHRPSFSGQGLFLSLEVEDAEAERERVGQTGLQIVAELRDESWGQRHFMLRDPAGSWVDVVQQIEPDPEFDERWQGTADAA